MIIGIAVIDGLERLHRDANIVHGDMHASNIVLTNIDDVSVELKFIDFERASWNNRKANVPTRNLQHATDVLFRRWALGGYAVSARDDVDRAIHTIARLINSCCYLDHETEVMNRGRQAVELHKNESAVLKHHFDR